MQLHQLRAPKGSRKRRKIVGRGQGSGLGKTSGRGENGQNSRSTGRSVVGSSEGGQMPLIRRLPKVGFRSHRPILNQVVTIEQLNNLDKDTVVTPEVLKAKGFINSLNKPIKILGDGTLMKSLKIQIKSVSKSAQEKILAAGGKIEIEDENDKSTQSKTKKK